VYIFSDSQCSTQDRSAVHVVVQQHICGELKQSLITHLQTRSSVSIGKKQ